MANLPVDPDLKRVVYAAFITLLITVGTYVTKTVGSSLNESRRKFWERDHIMRSIQREIQINLDNLDEFIPALKHEPSKYDSDENYKLFMATNHESSAIFKANRDAVWKLRAEIMTPIITYYAYDAEINQMMDKLETGIFNQLSRTRKQGILRKFIEISEEARASAASAIGTIDDYLKTRGDSWLRHAIAETKSSVSRAAGMG